MNEFLLAEVVSVETGGLILQIEGEENARVKEYKCLASYIPEAGHRVFVVAISGTYLVIGQVVDAPITTLIADSAAQADSATQADNALKLDGKLPSELDVKTAVCLKNAYNSASSFDIYLYAQYSNSLGYKVGASGALHMLQNG